MEPKQTRTQRKQETRASLIVAAAEVIAERGFQAAALADVAERAGVTTGAIYSNFRSKEALFFAVLESLSIHLDLDPASSSPVAERIAWVAETSARLATEPETRRLLQLQLEFALLALRDPATMSLLVDSVRVDRHALAELLEAGWSPVDPGPPPPPEGLAALLIAVMQGLGQQRLLDPDGVEENLFRWGVMAILQSAWRQAPSSATSKSDRSNQNLPRESEHSQREDEHK